jgi:uroporphyrinogen-III synthase
MESKNNNNKLALITRPIGDAKETESELLKIGISGFCEPLLEVYHTQNAAKIIRPYLDSCQALVATSANALRSVGAVNKKIITVGKRSAQIAKELGYRQVFHSSDNVTSLEKYIEKNFSPQNGSLLYISASTISKELRPKGFNVKRMVVYNSKPVEHLSGKCKELLQKKQFDYVLFFSTSAASQFCRLAADYDLKKTICCCLSKKVSEQLEQMGFKEILIAKSPNSKSLLELIKNL